MSDYLDSILRGGPRAIDSLFRHGTSFIDGFVRGPPMDMRETETSFIFEADLPGMPKDALDVSFRPGRLCVSGERRTAPEGDRTETLYHCRERFFGKFTRCFDVPASVGKIDSCRLDNGVLKVELHKDTTAIRSSVPIE